MKVMISLVAVASMTSIGVPAAAHPAKARPALVADHVANTAETAAVRAVLAKYQSAMERLDPSGTDRLFAANSTIFETGGVEGTYANYLAHHLTPELAEFKSFRFFDYKVDVRFEGALALANESYRYRIETKKGEIAERLGVATSVLKKVGGQWKIISMHNSARRPAAS